MIELHRLNGSALILNSSHIELIESTPDTVITLVNDKKYIVKESAVDVVNAIADYQRKIFGSVLRN